MKKTPPPTDTKPCLCWQTVNEKLAPMGVKLSDKLLAIRPTEDLDLHLFHQLPTEPLAGKFKASHPRFIGFHHCPFCGQLFESVKEGE
jgi:hypothetical protein